MNKLEEFVKFDLHIVIDTEHENPSLFNKEMSKYNETPTVLKKWQFDKIVELFEPYRESIEDFLRDKEIYNDCDLMVAPFIPDSVYKTTHTLLLNNFLK